MYCSKGLFADFSV